MHLSSVQIKPDVSRRGSADDGSEKLKVFLRIRPLTEAEQERGEEQVKESDTLSSNSVLSKEGLVWLTVMCCFRVV